MAVFSEEFFSANDFEAVLVTFCYYEYGVNASEAIEKITTDQKDYHKCSLCVIICCIAKYINNSKKGWLMGYLQRSKKKKLQKLYRKRSNNWSMISLSKVEVR